ncbi:hypothetical protein PGC35_05860, partial [Psychrobacillus sp. PGGUH221]|uniref:hypothetical protein n=1 Tax=Psychrobacillus sp. PGGUH221 TaxID=3020058 RepID=UPI0035C72A94
LRKLVAENQDLLLLRKLVAENQDLLLLRKLVAENQDLLLLRKARRRKTKERFCVPLFFAMIYIIVEL